MQKGGQLSCPESQQSCPKDLTEIRLSGWGVTWVEVGKERGEEGVLLVQAKPHGMITG
jgi:hypothetical protein